VFETNEFEIGADKFKVGKLDAFAQFHVTRRLGPLLAELFPVLQKIAKAQSEMAGLSEEEKLKRMMETAAPVMEALAKLSDTDADYVLYRLLSVVEVFQPKFSSWAKVATQTQLVMQTLEFPVLLQAAGRSLMFNLSGFFDSLPRK
jgi:hypothetical protein